MDKLVYDARGTTISNDGATIMKARTFLSSFCSWTVASVTALLTRNLCQSPQLLDIVHPAAKTLVEIAKSQDAEVRTLSFV